MDQVNALAWVGRSETCTGAIGTALADQIAATLQPKQQISEDLPLLWHWCGFPPTGGTDQLGSDGHPKAGGFLPPLPLERRMWAGGALRFHKPLRIGERLTKKSTVVAVDQKSENLALIQVEHEIYGEEGLAIEERQDLVFLPMADRFRPPKTRPIPEDAEMQHSVDTSTALLFRFSAITFNAHRIHYDLTYTQQVEKYPNLVVHGPLQAMLLMQAACDQTQTPPDAFDFRAVHPVFSGPEMAIYSQQTDANTLGLWTGQDGHQGVQATAKWQGAV